MTFEMTQNNNAKGPHDNGVSPVDSSIVTLSDPSITVIDAHIYIEGCPIKQAEIQKRASKLKQKYWLELCTSLLRNLLSWTCLITLLTLISNASSISDWPTDEVAILAFFFAAGVLGLSFHIYHCYVDLTFERPSQISLLLRDAMTQDDLKRRIQTYELSAPEILMEVSLKSGAMAYGDHNHWTRGNRKTGRELTYRGWADQSAGVGSIQLPAHTSAITITKDFRLVDDTSKTSFDAEVAEFRRDSGYDANAYFMHMEYVLNWKEADACHDVKTYLLFEDCRPYFYMLQAYRIASFLALDSLYKIAFHVNTARIPDYSIMKFIER